MSPVATFSWTLLPAPPATNEAIFVSFQCPRPADRDFQLLDFIPEINKSEDFTGDLKNFILSMQDVVDFILCDIDKFAEILDPDTARTPFLDLMLCDLGNPFSFITLSETDKRRLIDVLVSIYKQKGTGVGIINAIRFFLGIEVTIDVFNETEGWVLGVSELGIDTVLGPGTSRERFSFRIISPVALTDEQRTQIEQIVDFMKVGHEHLVEIEEPDTTVIDHWELGLSELGINTDLH